ncbi:MAG TPA: hypothetical protein VND15_03905 [Candidatus Acidoferrales bacterium]|nr:hypothetical protein [Candidatus Acidoferrales bacterium]
MTSLASYVKDRRILTLILVAIVLAGLDLHFGIHFGIEFVGGTQIPVTLAHPVNVTAMTALTQALEQRTSTFGLKQTIVEGIGDSHVIVQVPAATSTEINQTISILASQGRFDGIVNGRDAITGSDIVKGSIGTETPQLNNQTYDWIVTFFISQSASKHFAGAVLGAANKPLYMFLDRPQQTAIFINSSNLGGQGISKSAALTAMQDALTLGNQSIVVVSVDNTSQSISNADSFLLANKKNYKNIIASANLPQSLLDFMQQNNYTVKTESVADMTPTYIQLSFNQSILETWPIVGLLSSPTLSPAITNGNVSQNYQISGAAPLTVQKGNRYNYALNQSKTIASVLSGGALPVSIIAGAPTTVSATLGKRTLYISGLTGIIAIIFVSAFIVIRYRKPFLIVPILLTTLMELFIIISAIGLIGTIDLAAVAGMIAVVGTGVDAQIIITDELLVRKGGETSSKSVLGNAFYIIWMDAALLIIAMMPLFFSTSLTSVIGFSESTIIGALLGILITRPAYSAILSKRYD